MEGAELRDVQGGTKGAGVMESLVHRLKAEARVRGFQEVGIAAPDPSEHVELYRHWIQEVDHRGNEFTKYYFRFFQYLLCDRIILLQPPANHTTGDALISPFLKNPR